MKHEILLRLGCFLGVLAAMAVWEVVAPRRSRTAPRTPRWIANLGVAGLDTLVVRLVFPTAVVGTALLARENEWGLLNRVVLPPGAAVVFGILALDLVIYLQHALFHTIAVLWRFHRMHHADVDLDVTTAVRFHPVEIVVSMAIKMGTVALVGPPPDAVMAFEILLNAMSLFNHSNIRISEDVDRRIRRVVVTPDMHRVHHSVIAREMNSNFGFNLSWWDRLFGTYCPQPAAGHGGMTIGLPRFREPRWGRLDRMLWIPFARGAGSDPPAEGTDRPEGR